jgi:hypothetical protein
MFSVFFEILILKINFKIIKKYYFKIFLKKKLKNNHYTLLSTDTKENLLPYYSQTATPACYLFFKMSGPKQ